MQVTTWKTFVKNHLDSKELEQAASLLHQLINLNDTLDNNLDRITSSPCLVIVTNNTFREQPLPIFYHHRLRLPIQNTKKRLVSLTGFSYQASPVEIEGAKLCSATDSDITTPSLQDFITAAMKGSDAVKKLKPHASETHKIQHAAILPPSVPCIVMGLEVVSAEMLLWQTILVIRHKKPQEVIDIDNKDSKESNDLNQNAPPKENGDTQSSYKEEDWKFAQDYMPLLVTLWLFLRSTDKTKAIKPPMKSATIDRKTLQWCREVHEKCIYSNNNVRDQDKENHSPTPDARVIIKGINRLAKCFEDRNNDKFATGDNHNKKEAKGWKKLEATFQKVILFASTTDGETPVSKPTSILKNLLNTKNGAIVSRLFSSWHELDIIVQPGMASNIQKGSLLSGHSPFSITNFSPFLTPPARAGFTALSNAKLNSLDYASTNKNMTDKDIQKMVQANPYIPTQPHIFIAQLKNWHAVLQDIFGTTALITVSMEDINLHYTKNELLYYNVFEEDKNFPVWFLNQIHFKCQRLLHLCASTSDVNDIPFQQFTFKAELNSIGMNAVNAKAPTWYTKMKEKETNQQSESQGSKHNQSNHTNEQNQQEPKRRVLYNRDADYNTKLKQVETYSALVRPDNLCKCSESKVWVDGKTVCNNWHIRGWCNDQCARKATHTKLAGSNLTNYRAYVGKLCSAMNNYRRNNYYRHNNGNNDSSTNNTQRNTQPGEDRNSS